MKLKRPLLAISGLFGAVPGTSALPPKADITRLALRAPSVLFLHSADSLTIRRLDRIAAVLILCGKANVAAIGIPQDNGSAVLEELLKAETLGDALSYTSGQNE